VPHDLPAGPRQEEWRRTDVRRFHFEKFPFRVVGQVANCRKRTCGRLAICPTMLTAAHRGRRSGRPHHGAGQPAVNSSLDPKWPRRVFFWQPRRARSASMARKSSPSCLPARLTRTTTSSPPCTPPAGRRNAALRAQGRRDRPAAAHVLGAFGRAKRRFRPRLDRAGRGRAGYGPGRDRQPRSDRGGTGIAAR